MSSVCSIQCTMPAASCTQWESEARTLAYINLAAGASTPVTRPAAV
jgi:hypothetical protein